MNIQFLFGTETGSAEILCEDIQADLGSGFACEITPMSQFDPAHLNAETFYMFVTSTYGNGDLPSMAQPFYDALEAQAPDLSHVRFAIFGLGDMVFSETFAQGSQRLMDKLKACGALMVGDRGIHDASTAEMPEDIAVPWAHKVLSLLKAQAA